MAKLDTSFQEPYAVSCEGGLILDKSTFSVPPGAATALRNYEPNIAGGYRRISGFSPYSATALSGAGNVLGLATFGSTVVGCRGANVEHGTGTTWTSITSARTSASRYHFDKYNWTGTEKLVMVDDVNPAATWDGSTYKVLNGALGTGAGTAPTAPTCVAEHANHLFLGQGVTLTFSAPYDEDDYTPASGAGAIIIPETIKELKAFRSALYIFCENSIYKISGTSLDNFARTAITRNIGLVASLSVQEIGGDLVFLAPDGLRTVAGTDRIDDTEIGTISKPVQPRLNGVSTTSKDANIVSTVIREKSQYRLWFPAEGGAVSDAQGLIAVFKRQVKGDIQALTATAPGDVSGAGWEFADLIGIKPVYATSGYISGVETVLHGDSAGLVYTQETGADFNGTTINSFYRSPDLIIGDPGIRKNIQRIILNLENEGVTNAFLNVIYDFDDSNVPQPSSVTLDTSVGLTLYGDSGTLYGTSLYGVPKLNYERVHVEGSGFTIAIKITNGGAGDPFSIKGFQIEYTPGGRR